MQRTLRPRLCKSSISTIKVNKAKRNLRQARTCNTELGAQGKPPTEAETGLYLPDTYISVMASGP